ncbi:aldo/keto reductase [Streptomyces tuirus]|uniref:Aldo/keto reductase n=1 Tax=Streptomyces tuirus TaxID=68278 RepID=A0A941FE58_9ACTN|nr:aldo/keto reductase [Streptomyces tuirus]
MRGASSGRRSFDTAEPYGLGGDTSEQLLGRAVKDFRDEVVLDAKFGYDLTDMSRLGRAFNQGPGHGPRGRIAGSTQHFLMEFPPFRE